MTDADDWYSQVIFLLLYAFCTGLLSFCVVFLLLLVKTSIHFRGHRANNPTTTAIVTNFYSFENQMADTSELYMIKLHTRLLRLLSVLAMASQAMLLHLILQIPDQGKSGHVYAFSLFRPIANLLSFFLGFMTNAHAFFRLLFLLLLAQMIIIDTMDQVTIAMVVYCRQEQGLHCGPVITNTLSLHYLQLLTIRNYTSLFLVLWIMLETGYLCVAMGFFTSRYSKRKLSISRPLYNIRAALNYYFPTQGSRRQLRRR